jgi:transcriptional regulator with XRE-family HTH domain
MMGDEAKRREALGKKLRAARLAMGLSIADVCKLVDIPKQSASLTRIENPASAKGSSRQGTNGHALDVLFFEDLVRVYGESVQKFISQPRVKRLRTRADIMRAAASKSGIRRTKNGKRTFAVTAEGTMVTVGSQFNKLLKKKLIVAAHHQKNVTVYRVAPHIRD